MRIDTGLAFLFPGQGSQSVGMLSGLAAAYPEVASTFGVASEVLGYDLWDLVRHGPEERLNPTLQTQPAMLAAGVAVWRVWCRMSPVRPGWFAGHSLGEYTALVCAGALTFEDGLRLVAERARLMQEAVAAEAGSMAAILGLSATKVADLCRRASTATEIAAAANFNAPDQVVIAGHRAAVGRTAELARTEGAKRAVFLPISVPSHCPLMQPAAERLAARLADTPIGPPSLGRVVHNVDVAQHTAPEAIRDALCRQLYSPVRWTESIGFLAEQGVDRFVECGPGRILTGLNKRIVPQCRTEALFDPASLAKGLELVQ